MEDDVFSYSFFHVCLFYPALNHVHSRSPHLAVRFSVLSTVGHLVVQLSATALLLCDPVFVTVLVCPVRPLDPHLTRHCSGMPLLSRVCLGGPSPDRVFPPQLWPHARPPGCGGEGVQVPASRPAQR